MTVEILPPVAPIARLRARMAEKPWRGLLEGAARAGYVARGAVYVSTGVIGLLAALRLTPHAQGPLGALEAWSHWPPGVALLWVIGLGLYAFAGWRALQSVFDIDRSGGGLKATLARAGQAISGITYGALGVSVFGLIDALNDLRQPDEQAATRHGVEAALGLPFGDLLVMAAGVFVIAAGAGSIIRAMVTDLCEALVCDEDLRPWLRALAQVGYVGRGVALLPAGALLVLAGWDARAAEARGVGGALETLMAVGEPVLALTAVGVIAFGLFAILEGALRRIRWPAG